MKSDDEFTCQMEKLLLQFYLHTSRKVSVIWYPFSTVIVQSQSEFCGYFCGYSGDVISPLLDWMIWLSQMTEIWKEDKVTYWKQTYWTQTATTKTKCLAGMQAVFCYSGSFKGQFIIIKNEIFKLFKLLQEKVSLHFESKVLHWKINSYS